MAILYDKIQPGRDARLLEFNPYHGIDGRFAASTSGSSAYSFIDTLNASKPPSTPKNDPTDQTAKDWRRTIADQHGDPSEFRDFDHAATTWIADYAECRQIRKSAAAFLQRTADSADYHVDYAKTLLTGIASASSTAPALTRGDAVPNDLLATMAKGSTFDNPLLSFTKNGQKAFDFGRDTWNRNPDGSTLVIFALKKGAKAVSISGFARRTYREEQEWVTGGRFRVEKVTTNPTFTKIDIVQTGVFEVGE
jgi:hypothetical protein